MRITAELLQQATACAPSLAERYAGPLDEACRAYGISTPARLAMFIAQVAHESGGLRWVLEIWGPTAAQQRYEGRADIGNDQPGDGFRYRGRGLIQTTGRFNYRDLTRRLRARGVACPDFEAQPEQLEEPRWAVLSAADYWGSRGLNALADAGDFEAVTRRINGGLNGIADRKERWERAQRAIAASLPAAEPQSPTIPRESSEWSPTAETAAPPADDIGPLEAHPPSQESSPMPPILIPLAGALIEAFRPLAAEKVQAVLAKHGATADTAERITSAAIDAAQAVAGIADPIAAVAAVRADPAKMERVESAVLARVDELLPLVERLAAIDERARAADEASADAAAARSRADEWDMTRAIVYGGGGLIALLVALVGAVVLLQLLRPGVGAITSEVWAQVAGLIGFAGGVGTSIVAYRFGGRRMPAAQDVIAAASRLRREVAE